MKKSYQKPSLIVHGTVAQLTQANATGTKIDKTYTVGTPVVIVGGQLPNNLS